MSYDIPGSIELVNCTTMYISFFFFSLFGVSLEFTRSGQVYTWSLHGNFPALMVLSVLY